MSKTPVPEHVLDAAKAALRDHRGPTFATVASERGVDGREYPMAWEATCRCGEVTREYETHLLTVIAAAVLRAGAQRWVDGRLVDEAHPQICVHHVGVSPGLWCGACREGPTV